MGLSVEGERQGQGARDGRDKHHITSPE